MKHTRTLLVTLALLAMVSAPSAGAQQAKIVWTPQEDAIRKELGGLRAVPDDDRGGVTRKIALEIRQLPAAVNKVRLADGLASLSTEGYFGQDALQEVANTLAAALVETPQADEKGEPAEPYVELATLVQYEHVTTTLTGPQMDAAKKSLEADDAARRAAAFTLKDLGGKTWALKDLKGKVVLVNFWATWCPPCRKEMPDLDGLSKKFRKQGLVVLSISDEKPEKVVPYIKEHPVAYPILLDPGDVTEKAYRIEGIPKSFVYDREGKIVAQAIDMRTKRQFLEMLASAGLK
jgi:thiol-disulfide isomerase/thioredoxin